MTSTTMAIEAVYYQTRNTIASTAGVDWFGLREPRENSMLEGAG